MVVALTALFATTGGVSYAVATGSINSREIKNNSIRSRDIHNRSLVGKDVKRDALGGGAVKESTLSTVPGASASVGPSLFAVVNQNGTTVRARNLASSQRVGGANSGIYSVVFNRDVRGCVYQATLGDEGLDSPPVGEISVSSLSTSANGVRVVTRNSTGNASNRSFHLTVGC